MTSWNAGSANPAYGKHWYTDGKVNILANTCPAGFTKGRV